MLVARNVVVSLQMRCAIRQCLILPLECWGYGRRGIVSTDNSNAHPTRQGSLLLTSFFYVALVTILE